MAANFMVRVTTMILDDDDGDDDDGDDGDGDGGGDDSY